MAEHRVPMLGAALRRASLLGKVDPEHSADPKVRELVAALSTLEVAPAPRADFRAELRAQLVAVAPRLVAEGDPTLTTADERAEQSARKAADAAGARRGFRFAKPLIAAACVLTAFIVLLGGAVWISKKALPGDALYGLKRASETTEYKLTGGAVAKARLKLDFAKNRIDEVAALLPRASAMGAGVGDVAGGGVNDETASLVRETLSSADGDIKDAARMLTQTATRTKSSAPLHVFIAWAPGQLENMKTNVVKRIPTGNASLRDRATATWALITATNAEAKALSRTVAANAPGTSTTPPAVGTTTPGSRSGAPKSTSVPPAKGTAQPGRTGRTTTRGAGGSTTPKPPTSSSPVGGPTTSLPGPLLPSGLLPSGLLPSGLLPAPSSSAKLPVSVDSCGVHATLGPIDINLGSC